MTAMRWFGGAAWLAGVIFSALILNAPEVDSVTKTVATLGLMLYTVIYFYDIGQAHPGPFETVFDVPEHEMRLTHALHLPVAIYSYETHRAISVRRAWMQSHRAIEPILIRPDGGIIDGSITWEAARLLGYERVPVIVCGGSEPPDVGSPDFLKKLGEAKMQQIMPDGTIRDVTWEEKYGPKRTPFDAELQALREQALREADSTPIEAPGEDALRRAAAKEAARQRMKESNAALARMNDDTRRRRQLIAAICNPQTDWETVKIAYAEWKNLGESAWDTAEYVSRTFEARAAREMDEARKRVQTSEAQSALDALADTMRADHEASDDPYNDMPPNRAEYPRFDPPDELTNK